LPARSGLSQLQNLEANLAHRRETASRCTVAFRDLPGIVPPSVRDDVKPAWHLYPIRVDAAKLNVDRGHFLSALRSENIGVNIHYIPVHLHRYYREQFGYKGGEYPVAQRSYERLSSLPIFHGMASRVSKMFPA
jgi:perosamine synthetase